jgi:hypothetical protein
MRQLPCALRAQSHPQECPFCETRIFSKSVRPLEARTHFEMKANIASRLATNTPLLKELISGVKNGEIKIPQFQRKFVWKQEQALNFLDSIGSNYPVGSLLLWRTTSKLATERNLGEFKLPETDDLSPTDYVLDGQQRLTVIYSCFGAAENDEGFQAAYDLETESFIKRPDEHEPHIFPLRILYETTKLLNFRAGLISHPKGEKLQQNLDHCIEVITNYRIPVVTLKDLSVEEVCPNFERINSSGTPLSTYDLMVAATWSEQFDLNDETEIISDSLSPKGFGDIDGNTVLKCLAAVHHKGIKREQVLSLRTLKKEEIDQLVNTVKQALLQTVDLLSTEFKVYSWDFLPYEAYAIILCYVFAKRKALRTDDIKRVKQWFWSSAFSERYRGASEHFISKDLEYIDAYVVKSTQPNVVFGALPSPEMLSDLSFRSNNSRSRAFVLMLALRSPKNMTNGALIDTAEALSCYNKKQFHHIYPKAHLRRNAQQGDPNTLVNICILCASENNMLSDEDPNAYIPRLVRQHGHDASAVFMSNMLPDPNEVDYSSLSFEEFLQKRSYIIHAEMMMLAKGQHA